ncbi:hypothetical protein FRC04_007501 [Tulasnella sp. 424]|nr:hypothetical protein FRC04_007501 [Tulasnella sp. 424]KAG8975183.1 hypothetical protein FRC05_006351 [Tulasnella sp. 425]
MRNSKIASLAPVLLAFLARVVVADVAVYGQCGGLTYTGETTCVSGSVCTYQNDYYSQCVPDTAATTTTTSKATTATTTTNSSSTSTSKTSTTTTTTKSSTTTTTTRSSTTSTTSKTSTTSSSASAAASGLYVATTGSDSNPGTLASPFLTIQKGVDTATAGTTIYIRAGTYSPSTNIKISKNGTSTARYTVKNYNGEKVIVDGENLTGTPADLGASLADKDRGVFHINGYYWTFSGLEIINGPYAIYSRDASYNTYENLIVHDNYESGVQIQGAASYNTIINLDSYRNRDPRKNGESADGLAIKEGSGVGNVVRGARLWDNSDDGLDFWEFTSPITVEYSYSWGNGFNRWNFTDFTGDGNGFKFGGGNGDTAVAHVFRNCMAFSNAVAGFIDNTQKGAHTVDHNTAWNNPSSGFDFEDSTPTLTYNLAVSNNPNFKAPTSGGSQTGNSWQSGTWSNSSFKSTDATTLQGARNSDGTVKASDFLLPASGASIGAVYQ